jgi:drug/metabolite transporter (DMT)-like permease
VHAQLLLVAVIWGGTNPAIKHLLDRLHPIDLFSVRVGGAALVFAALLATRGRHALPRSWRDAAGLFALGAVGITVMNFAMLEGQQRIPAALASLVVTTNPIHTALIAALLGYERLSRPVIGGIALASVGFAIIVLLGTGGGARLDGGELTGMLIVAIAPFTWAFYTVLSKPYLERYPPIQVAGLTAIAGAAGGAPLVFLSTGAATRFRALDGTDWLLALYLAGAGYVLAYTLWYRGLRVLSASQTAVYIYLVPVFGILFARVFLDEEITLFFLLGAAVILAGVVLTNSARTRGSPRIVTAERARSPSRPSASMD